MAKRTDDWVKISKEFQTRGEKGLNKGIPFRLNTLNKYIPGTQRGRYLLYFAGPGVGKSKVVYDQHIFVPYDYILNNNDIDLHIHLWSLEINPIFIIGAAKVYWLYTRKHILTDINHIYSIGENKLSPTIKLLLDSDECAEYLNGLSKILTIHTQATRYSIDKTITAFAQTRGKCTYTDNTITSYEPNNPQELVILIIDHMALVTDVGKDGKKQTIDGVSNSFRTYRDVFKYAPIVIQQVNPEKYNNDNEKILPKHEDLRDSKNTFQDCDSAISIGNPFQHGIKQFAGYKIIPETPLSQDYLGDRFRVLQVVKNRYGRVSVLIPTLFIGEVGYYTNIDPPNTINYAKMQLLNSQ